MLIEKIADGGWLTNDEIRETVIKTISGRAVKKCLLLPPDYSRFHSNAGLITNIYYNYLTENGTQVDIMPALGTHAPMNVSEIKSMYGDIPAERFLVHDWRNDVLKLGEVPGDYIASITDGLWNEPVAVEINKLVCDPSYDLIISVGQVVPHEVVGMSNYTKNLFVGVGGSDMINKSHMIGAVYGLEKMMGKCDTPVRAIYDYGLEHYLEDIPILFVMTVCTAPEGEIHTHGIFAGDTRKAFEDACVLALQKNTFLLDRPIRKCVVHLDEIEFKSTWIGNKSIYRTRMAIADGGELIVLAPGVERFGEDPEMDELIRKYGYMGRLNILEAFNKADNKDLRENMGGAAHLIHGSSDGRFSITYAVKKISEEEVKAVGFKAASCDEMAKVYDSAKLKPGFQMVNGEEIYYIHNPALGLWFEKSRIQ